MRNITIQLFLFILFIALGSTAFAADPGSTIQHMRTTDTSTPGLLLYEFEVRSLYHGAQCQAVVDGNVVASHVRLSTSTELDEKKRFKVCKINVIGKPPFTLGVAITSSGGGGELKDYVQIERK